MPVVEAIILYVGDKILAQIIKDEIWSKRLFFFFCPATDYKKRLLKIITETIDEFEKIHPYDSSNGKFPFYQSQIFFEHLSLFVLFKKGSLETINGDFEKFPKIIPPTQQDLEDFYLLFLNKVNTDEVLKSKFIEENYKKQIYEASKIIADIKIAIDSIKEDTAELLAIAKEKKTLILKDDWFQLKLEEAIKNLDKRYTPELNFDLPIAKVFEGLSRDKYFKEQFISHLDGLLRNYNKAVAHVREERAKERLDKIVSEVSAFRLKCELIDFAKISTIGQEELVNNLESCKEAIDALIHLFYDLDSEAKKEKKEKKEQIDEGNNFGWDIEYLGKLNGSISEFIDFISGSTVSLSNNPFLLLTGDAGIGKSHLLADVALKRKERNQFTILLLGQHFTSEEPWSQIKKLLQLDCDRDAFLTSLNIKAETSQSRILIFIDAINEGEGKKIWKNHIAGFISAVKRFPHLGVVFSVRSSYEKLLIPEILLQNKEVIKVRHRGFGNHEYEASKLFFENYNIKQPSIPMLHPEFSNPLFLKLFCEGLNKKGLHEIPDGYEGISTIIGFYLESINSKISEKHNLPVHLNVVQKIAKQIAGKIAESENTYLKFDEAFSFVTQQPDVTAINDKSQFFQDLISEGLLTQNLYWDRNGSHYEGVYISYERFSDHLVCSYLIDNYLDKSDPKNSFKEGTRLYELVKNEQEGYFNKGIIEAFSIQLPERINLEFFEAAEHAKYFEPIASAFVESIIWRKKDTLNDKLKDYINEVVINKFHYEDYFINTIFLVTSHPNHYFNSDFLHNHLMRFSLPDRDEWWTKFIHHKYPGYPDEISSIKRMIDWAWTEDKRENISDESIRLMCQTMFWFLTSTNRTLRDSTTKAIICLLEERIHVLIGLIKTFEKVNDPYVLQRLYGIAYGCAVRTSNMKALKELGDVIFQSVFNTEHVIPDILLRDYARGVIEYAVFKEHKFQFDLKKIRPPFKSDFPKTFPTKEDISKYEFDYKKEDFKKYYWSQNSIIDSMKTNSGGQMYGDFGRYTFESAFRDWKDVNPQDLSNLAVKWIIEKYGYDVEKHGEFDRTMKSHNHSRHYVMEERIGKKYQWIAFYEILARVSDNYICYEDSYSKSAKSKKYDGPWDPYIRDIDPTIIIKGNPENKFEKFWWNQVGYSNWNVPNKDWVFSTDDLPNPLEIINVVDADGVEWLVLEVHSTWTEPADIGEDKYENPHKDLWYQIRSYLTTKEEPFKIAEWAKGKNFMGRWMPESGNRYEMFSREYYWSPAAETFRKEYYGGNDWSEIHDKKTGEFIGKVAVTTIDYLWEEQFDASKQSTISFYKPTELLFNMLDLQYCKVEGQLLNKNNEMICFDPCATHPTHSCLLVRKKDLLKKLEENGLDIFWTVLAEKLMIGGRHKQEEYVGRLNISGVVHFEAGSLKHTAHFEQE